MVRHSQLPATNRLKSRSGPSDSGATFIELLIALPIILLFTAGVIELGRFFADVSQAAQIAYEVSMVGSVNPPGNATKALMYQRYQQIMNIKTTRYLTDQSMPEPSYAVAGQENMLNVNTVGRLRSLWPKVLNLQVELDLEVTGPVLARDVSNIGDENDFANTVPVS